MHPVSDGALLTLLLLAFGCGRVGYPDGADGGPLDSGSLDATARDGSTADAAFDAAPTFDAGVDAGGEGGTPDAGVDAALDAAVLPPVRVVSTAYYSGYYTSFFSAGMDGTHFSIPTNDVRDNEFLLLFACVDDGSTTVWPNPIAPGFVQLAQDYFGAGQSCQVSWKVAATEPARYFGAYGAGVVSGSAALALVAVDTAATSLDAVNVQLPPVAGAGTSSITMTSGGVTTTVANDIVILAAAADWFWTAEHDIAMTSPGGYQSLLALTDQGSSSQMDWASIQIDWKLQVTAGDTNIATVRQSTTTSGASAGAAWTAMIAVPLR
jgi:hypothetical protein